MADGDATGWNEWNEPEDIEEKFESDSSDGDPRTDISGGEGAAGSSTAGAKTAGSTTAGSVTAGVGVEIPVGNDIIGIDADICGEMVAAGGIRWV